MKLGRLLLHKVWPRYFARVRFARFNYFLFELALSGLGVLNWRSPELSGEAWIVSSFLKKRFRKRKELVIVDVGSHFGESAEEFRAAFPEARIIAIEPSPSAFRRAGERLASCNVELHQAAVTDQAGAVDLFDYEEKVVGSQHASLFEDVFKKGKTDARCKPVQVEATTLDQLGERSNLEWIDFLKIDTEGCELRVLQGAGRLLAQKAVDVIQFEFNEMNVFSRVFMQDFFALLDGYVLYRLLPEGLLRLNPHSMFTTNVFAFQNIVAVRKPESPVPDAG